MPFARATGSRTRKTLSFFRVNFGHAPPYEVLCDGPTIFQSLNNDLYLKQSLPKLLGGPAYPVVTQCVVKELRSLGEAYTNAALFAKRVKRISCVHEGESNVTECLTALLRKQSETKLVLATNDHDVVAKVDRIPGVPIVSILNQTKFVLKAPSAATLRFVKESEKVKNHGLSAPDKALVDDLKAAERQLMETRLVRKKRKRAKGPNPLSVKKSKVIREKCGENQIASSLISGSAVSPDDTLVPDTRNGAIDALDSKRTGDQAAKTKLHESDIDLPDADKGQANRKRIGRVERDSCEFSDVDGNNAIKGMGETATKAHSRSCTTPKSRRRRRKKEQNGMDDNGAATKTAEDFSRTLNLISAQPQAEGSLNLKDGLENADGLSQRRIARNLPTRTPGCKQGAPNHVASVETEGHAAAGSPQPLDHNPIPNTDEAEPSEDKVATNEQMEKTNSDALENRNKDKSQGPIERQKSTACDTDSARLTGVDEVHAVREGDVKVTSAGVDEKKKKKQRKNRRRRPKKKDSD